HNTSNKDQCATAVTLLLDGCFAFKFTNYPSNFHRSKRITPCTIKVHGKMEGFEFSRKILKYIGVMLRYGICNFYVNRKVVFVLYPNVCLCSRRCRTKQHKKCDNYPKSDSYATRFRIQNGHPRPQQLDRISQYVIGNRHNIVPSLKYFYAP